MDKDMATLRQQIADVKALLIVPEEPVSLKLPGVPIVRGTFSRN